jgi:hypothetical protein
MENPIRDVGADPPKNGLGKSLSSTVEMHQRRKLLLHRGMAIAMVEINLAYTFAVHDYTVSKS